MKIEELKPERVQDFIAYCKKHIIEVDDSFLYDEDLKSFMPNEDNPTYIAVDENGNIKAAASLMIDEYHKRGKKARFRILHSEIEKDFCYDMLLKSILKHTEALEKIFVFLPATNEKLIEQIKSLNFKLERYTFLLVREDLEIPEFTLPKDYEIRSFRQDHDEETWCIVRNAAFAKLQGSETPITKEMVRKMISGNDYLEGGLMILYHKEKPIGVVRGASDDYEDAPIMNIGPVAIIPEYQGKGLGRCLLRAVIKFAKDNSYNRTILCVNAENERAKSLYLKEGFKQVESVACYNYNLRK